MKILTEVISWLRIALSPTLIGIIIGGILYVNMGNEGLIACIVITAVGGIIGVFWATKIWKSQGTTNFISRINATPELDNKKSES